MSTDDRLRDTRAKDAFMSLGSASAFPVVKAFFDARVEMLKDRLVMSNDGNETGDILRGRIRELSAIAGMFSRDESQPRVAEKQYIA